MNAISPEAFVYKPAVRKNVGLLIMLAGGSGSGKTLTALMLARGLVGPEGKVAVADTENERALFYADDHRFDHLTISEPFRPAKFEAAAVAAQQQGAGVLIIDSFSHEHVGPGGMLDYHENELTRLMTSARKRDQNSSDYELRDRLNFTAWIAPKGEHKHMLQRLWQLNCHIILCCQAEKKTAMQKDDKGKLRVVDQGFVPTCGSDIPYAMTMSFMLDVKAPGVPIALKPMLRGTAGLIDFSKPLDEAAGARLAAWAAGKKFEPAAASAAKPARAPAPAPQDQSKPPPAEPPVDPEAEKKQAAEDAKILEGARDLAARFLGTHDRKEHLAIVDEEEARKRIAWLKKHRREVYAREVEPAIKASWARTDEKVGQQQGMEV